MVPSWAPSSRAESGGMRFRSRQGERSFHRPLSVVSLPPGKARLRRQLAVAIPADTILGL